MEESNAQSYVSQKPASGGGKDDQRRFSKWLSIRKHSHLLSTLHTSSDSFLAKFRTAWSTQNSKDSTSFFLEREGTAYLRIILLGVMILLNLIAPFYRLLALPFHSEETHHLPPSIVAQDASKKQKINAGLSALVVINVILAAEIELQKSMINRISEGSQNNLFKLEFIEEKDEIQNDHLQYITSYSLAYLFSLFLLPKQLPDIDSHSLLPLQFLGFAYLQIRYQTCLRDFNGWQFSFTILIFIFILLRKSLWQCLYKNSKERRLSGQIKDGIMRNIKSFYNNVFELMPQGIAIIDSEKDLVFNNKAIKTLMDCQTQDLVKNIRGIMLKRKGDASKVPDDKSKMTENNMNSPEPIHQFKKSTTVPDRVFASRVGQTNITDLNDFQNNNNNNSPFLRSSRGSQKLQRINKATGFLQSSFAESVICDNIEQIIDELLIFGKKQKRQNNLIKKLHTVIYETSQKSKLTSMDEEQNIIFANDSITIFLCEYSIRLDREAPSSEDNIDFVEPVILVIIEDITDQVIKKELETLTQYRLKLLASISHELKTPLNASINILENLHGQLPDDIYSSSIKPALFSNKYLLNVFNDILDYQAIESKTFSYFNSRFNLRELLMECLDIIHFQLSFRNLVLNFGYDENIPQNIVSDPARIRQVLLNLLSNAMKFTSAGTITLKAILLQNGEIEISVSDTGIGISKENQTMIFNLCGRREFLQKNSKLQLNTQGAGLGLSVSSQLVKGLSSKQSEMIVESEENKGSKFSFWISCQPQSTLQESHLLSQPFMNELATPNGGGAKTGPSKFSIDIHNDTYKLSNMRNQISNQQFDIHSPLKDDEDKRKDSCDVSKYSRYEDETHVIQLPQETFNLKFRLNEDENDLEGEENFLSNAYFQTFSHENRANLISQNNIQNGIKHDQDKSNKNKDDNNNSNTLNNNSPSQQNFNLTFTKVEPGKYLPPFAFRYSYPNQNQAIPSSMSSLAHIAQQDLAIAAQIDSQGGTTAQQTTTILPFNQTQYPDMAINRTSATSTQIQGALAGMKNDQINLSISQYSSSSQQIELVKSPLHLISSSNVVSQQSVNNTDHLSSNNNRDSFMKYIINSREKNDSIQQQQQGPSSQRKPSCSCVPFISIDDNQMNLVILQTLIKQLGYTCDLAQSGQIGIDTVKARFTTNKCCKLYTMIFCDIDMPIKNGFQTIDEINKFFIEKGMLQQNIPPVTACSALNFPEFRDQCKQSGMTYFLPKPVNKLLLSELIIKAYQFMSKLQDDLK